ncbi:unnamed protein product, partial [Ectocarpus sp. 12 AP-2014]
MGHPADASCSCGAARNEHHGSSGGDRTETWASRRVVIMCAAAAAAATLVVTLTVARCGPSTGGAQHQDCFGNGSLGEYRDQGG